MTKEQVIATIKEAAERHGFTTCKYTMTRLIEIKEPGDTHYLNYPEKLVIPRNPKETNAIGCINQENSE